MVSIVTAMPEMATGISAAALVGSPDLAVGTLIGSCCFNLSILAILDWRNHKRPVLGDVSDRHLPAVRWGLVLLAVAGAGLILSQRFSLPTLAWLSLPGLLLLILYPLALRTILRSERTSYTEEIESVARYATFSLRSALIRFSIAAVVVIAAGIWLSFIGDKIAATTGWGTSFVGNLLLAIATSAPELVVGITAVRIGSPDIAVADILGANMLDTGMLGLVDAFYIKGSVFAAASPVNLAVIVAAAVMVSIVGYTISHPPSRLFLGKISIYGPWLVAFYLGAAYLLFTFGSA